MDKRLYVTNLSAGASLASLRRCFAECGAVSDVEFAVERHASASSSAYVTMVNPADAEQALRRLNGTLLEGRPLVVTLLPGRFANGQGSERRGRAAAAPVGIVISQQYRERHNMTYELDCQGARLVLRIFFPPVDARPEWRIEARMNGDAGVIEKAAPTREMALRQISEAWELRATTEALPSLDWPAVTRAMQGVRAI